MSAEIDGLTVRFGETVAVDDASLSITTGERFAVMGPSGSGKSSLLRAVAGLEHVDSGTIAIDGVDMTTRPTHLRPIGLMFQEYALFPHLSVEGNIAYGLRMQNMPGAEAGRVVARMLAIARLSGFENRDISSLSGGERQRVALLRTLAPEPSLVMLDEPLGSLDLALRESLLAEMKAIIVDLETTALYVTHDRVEAFAFADRIGIMRNGRIVRVGTPAEVWLDPQTTFVARFLGHANVVNGAVLGRPGETILVPMNAISVQHDGQLETTVLETTFSEGRYLHTVATDGGVTLRVAADAELNRGRNVGIAFDMDLVQTLKVDEV